jgi:MSHA biogenesis protein MshG
MRHLISSDLIVTQLRQKPKSLGELLRLPARPLKGRKVVFFARSLATLHRAGVALAAALELVASQTPEKDERRAIEGVRSDVMKGKSLAEALASQSPAFPVLLSGAVEVGEAAGALDRTLDSAAALLERDENARAELRAALRYPVLVVLAITAAVIVLLTLVVPKFAKSYAEMGTALPLPTVLLIRTSETVVNYWYYPVLVLALVGGGIWQWRRTEAGRRTMDALLFRVPLIGSLAAKSLTSRTCEIMKVLSQAGLPVLNALEMSARTIGNRLVASELLEVRTAVAEGSDLASRFRSSRVFPALAGELISVGERSGALDEMLGAAAEYFRQEADRERKRMTAMIEPALTICLGLLVLGMALAIFLPMWDSMSLYRGG